MAQSVYAEIAFEGGAGHLGACFVCPEGEDGVDFPADVDVSEVQVVEQSSGYCRSKNL